jgi:pantothenate kinase
MTAAGTTPAELAARALELLGERPRVLVAIAGSPGSGKTTLARQVVTAIDAAREPGFAAYLPMDGFHLANATLDALGRHDRKGAIDTFDAQGFVALLTRVANDTVHTAYAPAFERTVDEPVAGAIAIRPSARIVVVEGNYLLVDDDPWRDIRELVAEAWFVETPAETRFERLVDRHVRHGRSPADAAAWATTVDGANSRLIEPTQARAALIVPGVTP